MIEQIAHNLAEEMKQAEQEKQKSKMNVNFGKKKQPVQDFVQKNISRLNSKPKNEREQRADSKSHHRANSQGAKNQ